MTYASLVPKLWNETIEAHRREVRDAIMETTAGLVAERGLLAVTMSQIAEGTGIGRATLYKYFPHVESILFAWHDRQISNHLERLAAARDRERVPYDRLLALLNEFALVSHASRGHHDTELAALLHRDHRVAGAEQRVRQMFREVLDDAARAGEIRDDVPTDELATFCVHALAAANRLSSKAGVRRLVDVTLSGVRSGP